ncbi:MAG: hypothetical protein WCC14_17340 [Acidobacteriaceae bacterium]
MVAKCNRTCPLSRRMLIAASALAVGFSLSAAAQTANAPAPAAQAQSYSSSSSPYLAFLSSDALPTGSFSAAPTASPSPQYGNNRYPSYPNYTSSWSHIAIEAGAGFTAPIGNDTHPYESPGWNVNETWGYNINVGGGWNFTKHFGALLEYTFDKQKIPGATLSTIYAQANDDGADLTYPLGGNVNTWSLTVDPIYYLPVTHKSGVYVTGGGGFYRKVANFTEPELEEECYYYYCGYGYGNATAAHSSSNQGGINAGLGIYWKAFGADSNAKFYAETRYVWVDSPVASNSDPFGGGTEGLVPVTFGIRF